MHNTCGLFFDRKLCTDMLYISDMMNEIFSSPDLDAESEYSSSHSSSRNSFFNICAAPNSPDADEVLSIVELKPNIQSDRENGNRLGGWHKSSRKYSPQPISPPQYNPSQAFFGIDVPITSPDVPRKRDASPPRRNSNQCKKSPKISVNHVDFSFDNQISSSVSNRYQSSLDKTTQERKHTTSTVPSTPQKKWVPKNSQTSESDANTPNISIRGATIRHRGRRYKVVCDDKKQAISKSDDNVVPQKQPQPHSRNTAANSEGHLCNIKSTSNLTCSDLRTNLPAIDVISPSPTFSIHSLRHGGHTPSHLSRLSPGILSPNDLRSQSSASSSGTLSPASLRCPSSHSTSSDSSSPLPPLKNPPSLRRRNLLPPIPVGDRTLSPSSRNSSPLADQGRLSARSHGSRESESADIWNLNDSLSNVHSDDDNLTSRSSRSYSYPQTAQFVDAEHDILTKSDGYVKLKQRPSQFSAAGKNPKRRVSKLPAKDKKLNGKFKQQVLDDCKYNRGTTSSQSSGSKSEDTESRPGSTSTTKSLEVAPPTPENENVDLVFVDSVQLPKIDKATRKETGYKKRDHNKSALLNIRHDKSEESDCSVSDNERISKWKSRKPPSNQNRSRGPRRRILSMSDDLTHQHRRMASCEENDPILKSLKPPKSNSLQE